jgi:hypothetical protein
MIDLRINGLSVVQYPLTTVPMELLNSALAEGLEDSFSLPFEVPVEGNEGVLGPVDQMNLRNRTIKYSGAQLFYHGALKHTGVLYVEDVHEGTVQLSFSVDGFVAEVGERSLKDVDYGGVISIAGEATKLPAWAALRNAETYPTASHCFPMFYNPELQSNNPSYYPDQPAFDSSKAYAVNDLITFEQGTQVRRMVGYQCISATSAGQSPATHPTRWRRTAFGIVNHWDHATATFFENNTTDGNPYAMVPFFYLKWVLQKVFADLGYSLSGDFMADTRNHQLAVYNNTALDDGSRAGYFNVAHSVAVAMPINNGVVPSNTESGGTLSDPGSLWNNTTYRFTCDAAGRRVFDITYNITPARPGWFRFLIRDAVTLAVLASVTDPTIGSTLSGTARLLVDFVGVHIGDDWELVLEVFENVAANGTILPAKQTSTLNSVGITSWRYDNTNVVNAMTLLIDPRDHVPDQPISAFILDICDLFCLERRFDHGLRRAQLNYKNHVLTDVPVDITAEVRSEPVLRFQETPKGYRFKHAVEDEGDADLTSRTREDDEDTEPDLQPPPSATSYVVVRNSRRQYVSRFAADGNLYWWPAGWNVPQVIQGEDDEPQEVAPGWSPMLMDLVVTGAEEFLVPVISEAGNSAMFGTEGQAPSTRLVLYHGLFRNANGVDYPFASSWNREHAGGTVADLSLNWEGPDGLLDVLAGSYYQRLAGCEVVECDLEANAIVLAAVENRPVMIKHQRCLLERLPLTYADGLQPLVGSGARLYRLPPA